MTCRPSSGGCKLPVAALTLKHSIYYRREAFVLGLQRCGFSIQVNPVERPRPEDVIVVWNRGPLNDIWAKRYEAAGARVIVVENGYIGRDRGGHILFAMALWHHNGAGTWEEGDEDRWAQLGIPLNPWRAAGDEIIVLPQRSIGEPGIAMPPGWTENVVRRLRGVTDRPVRVRPHPGKDKTDPYPDLERAWAAVTWASGAGVKSIVYGVPVFHEMPSWVGRSAACFGIERLERPFLGDRLPMLRRLAHAQWTLDEIQSGEPFRRLLESRSISSRTTSAPA